MVQHGSSTEVSETRGSLGAGDAACVTATDATALSRPSSDEGGLALFLGTAAPHMLSPPPKPQTWSMGCCSLKAGDNERVVATSIRPSSPVRNTSEIIPTYRKTATQCVHSESVCVLQHQPALIPTPVPQHQSTPSLPVPASAPPPPIRPDPRSRLPPPLLARPPPPRPRPLPRLVKPDSVSSDA